MMYYLLCLFAFLELAASPLALAQVSIQDPHQQQEDPLLFGQHLGAPVEIDTLELVGGKGLPRRNDVMSVIYYQTPVKSQGQRNTCTVFSMTALIESLSMIQSAQQNPNEKVKNRDLSEQWVQYIYALQSPAGGGDGAYINRIFSQMKVYGIPEETDLSYDTDLWSQTTPAAQICNSLSGVDYKRCLSSHLSPQLMAMSDSQLLNKDTSTYNPDFVQARQSALASKTSLVTQYSKGGFINSQQVKQRLTRGIPVAILMTVYYGSWNHQHGESLYINIDSKLYRQGIVTFPENGSIDLANSPLDPALHSVVIVGYDDDVKVTYSKVMANGASKTFTRTGVYYFKNSWGTKGFGSSFSINGKKLPGFGMMTQDYANQYGKFFAVDLAPGISL